MTFEVIVLWGGGHTVKCDCLEGGRGLRVGGPNSFIFESVGGKKIISSTSTCTTYIVHVQSEYTSYY